MGGVTLMLPLYEAKMIHLYDTRWATYEPDGSTRLMTEQEKADRKAPTPRYWVAENEVELRWPQMAGPLLGFRNIARSTDERTIINSLVPKVAVGHSLPLVAALGARRLQAALSSLVVDYVLRQKLGGTNLTYNYMQQLPISSDFATRAQVPGCGSAWVERKVDLLNAWVGSPSDRAVHQAELDGYCFHEYGLDREAVSHVLESFPVLRRKEESRYGEFQTSRFVLAAYDAMTLAVETGQSYVSPFNQGVRA